MIVGFDALGAGKIILNRVSQRQRVSIARALLLHLNRRDVVGARCAAARKDTD